MGDVPVNFPFVGQPLHAMDYGQTYREMAEFDYNYNLPF